MVRKNQQSALPAPTGDAGLVPAVSFPEPLAQVALIDAKTAAAAGSVSLSWWYQSVADGVAPQPAFRGDRLTRWRVTDVAEFWRNYGAAKKAA